MFRRLVVATALAASLTLAAAPAIAQVTVSVQNPSFSWTGKQDQRANYRWSASIDNPSRREVVVDVRIELLDAAGAVVGSDTRTVTVARESGGSVSGETSLPYADASRATQYRITLEAAEE